VPDGATLALFFTTALVLLVIPGPAVVFIVARSVEHGRAVGIASAVGVATGGLVHVAGAAVGLSAILVRSAAAFSAVKLVGGGYLVWLGARRLLGPTPPAAATTRSRRAPNAAPSTASVARAFRQGVAVNVLNPKVALFFLAFLPRFVDAERGSVLVQTIVLGMAFLLLGMTTDSTYAVVAGTIAARIRRRRSGVTLGQRLTGLVYVGLGVTTALTPGSGSSTPVDQALHSAA